MPTKSLSLSIVIPVYNEEHHLRKCLDAIAAQTEPPDEVIVVDNNSTDNSAQIAASYAFITVLHETRQHQTFAQRLGFDESRSDILCRIDADTIIPPNWAKKVRAAFDKSPDVVAISGDANPYDIPLKRIGTFAFRLYHHHVSRFFAGHAMLWGANMAIARKGWEKVRDEIVYQPNIWEDYELAFALAKYGKIKYQRNLKVGCSFRAAHRSLAQQFFYQFRAVRTFYLHTGRLRTLCFMLAWYTMVWVFPFAFVDRYLWKWQNRQHRT